VRDSLEVGPTKTPRDEERMRSTTEPSRGGYSPVVTSDDGSVLVELDEDHPGFSDSAYRDRRNAIALLSVEHQPGEPVPVVDYTDEEHEVWGIVSRELSARHDRLACKSYLEAKESLSLPEDQIPQLTEVSNRLAPLTGFDYQPVAGLAPLREFYSSFARKTFYSTQYIRHPSYPQYTPEPDIVHEVIGHANQLADPTFADICVAVGDAVDRTESVQALGFLSRVFWFTMEFGVVWEDGELKTYGAGILSSIGELDYFRSATIRPLDFTEMGVEEYDITHFQPVLYSLDSVSELHDRLFEFYGKYDDNAYESLTAGTTRASDV
jgi:phenylalanine-4-hydroxylase